jgi:hypothetical protein
MHSAAIIRLQIEAALAHKIPSALTPAQKVIRPVAPTGVADVDRLLEGGLPVGAITELVGPESSGRTAVALSFLSHLTHAGKVCAWVDASDVLSPESAAAEGVNLSRLLWVRCGVSAAKAQLPAGYTFTLPDKYLVPAAAKNGLHGGGCGGHPRNEIKGLAEAVSGLLRPPDLAPRRTEQQGRALTENEIVPAQSQPRMPQGNALWGRNKPWARIEQALRVTDLLLQAGGFSAIVLDMAGVSAEHVSRVPMATWFRYRASAERTQASVLLLTQHPCAKSSSELLLRFQPGEARHDDATVFAGIEHCVAIERQRFATTKTNVIPLRKPPESVNAAHWRSEATWAGPR